jgi:peptide/nickel transport system permease protein
LSIGATTSDTFFAGSQTRSAGKLRKALRLASKNPVGAGSAVVLVCIITAALLADLIAPYSPNEHGTGPILAEPSLAHPAGTDHFGRDVFSRVVHGSRTSLYVGFTAALLATVGATALGVASAYVGRWLDYAIQRCVETVQAIPALVLLLGILIVLGPSVTNIIIALALRQSFTLSRVVRGSVLGVQSLAYVEAARVVGASGFRIILRHIIPNIAPVLIVLFSLDVGTNILAEASLSFLGYGTPPPTPSWGGMMSVDGRAYMILAPWILIAPAVALSLVVFSVNMLGDTIRDILDPRLRNT